MPDIGQEGRPADARVEDAFRGIVEDRLAAEAKAADEAAYQQALKHDEQVRAHGQLNGGGESQFTPVLECAAELETRAIDWAWKPWLAAGEFHLLVGRKATGKTTLALTIAAQLSRGEAPFSEPGKALMVCLEDNWESVLLPRLEAAGARMDNIFVLRIKRDELHDLERPLALETDLPDIQKEATHINSLRLIVLDPVIRAAGGKLDSHNANQVRQALDPVSELARATGAAVLGITHFRKSQGASTVTSSGVIDSVMGSGAWTQVARLLWVSWKQPESNTDLDEAPEYEHCLGVFGNLVAKPKVLPYAIAGWTDNPDVAKIQFGAEAERDPEAMMESKPPSKLAEAEAWIIANVPPGLNVPSKEIEDDAKAAGHSGRTLQRAKTGCGVKSIRIDGLWHWRR